MSYSLFIENTLKKATKIANQKLGKVKGKTKKDNSILTEVDLEIGTLIAGEIKKAFPQHNTIDEETGVIDNGSEFTWITDPIDGTTNYALGIPLYGIMIGLLKNNKPIAGGISLPEFKEIYLAEKNKGATCNGKNIHVTHETKLSETLVAYGPGYKKNLDLLKKELLLLANILSVFRNLRSSGSCFDNMMVANGKYGAEICLSNRIWDNVPQHIITEEAGGVYTDFFGKPMDYTNPLTKQDIKYTSCAASPFIHKKLQEIIQK